VEEPGGDDADRAMTCRFYTAGRRHPIMIGNLQGLRIPPMTPAQLGVGLGSLLVLLVAHRLWAHFGTALNGLLLVAVPVGLAWAVRAVRMEGRAPWRAGLGWLQLMSSPRHGSGTGRRQPGRGGGSWRGRVWLADVTPARGSGR
jgi:hypothetical protein